MKKFVAMGLMALGLWACEGSEQIPDCAYQNECAQRLPDLSKSDFNDERYEVLTIADRDALDPYFQIYQVESPYRYPAGTIVIDTPNRVLYLIEEQGLARRYPIAIGKDGYRFAGRAHVGRMVEWPLWYPTPDMRENNPDLPDYVEGGARNPLGARAIYLYEGDRDTLYRIHGNNEPFSIGRDASSGCIRMYNEDVIDLYNRVDKGTEVVVIGLEEEDGTEVDMIGEDETPLEERELTEAEDLFYSLRDVFLN